MNNFADIISMNHHSIFAGDFKSLLNNHFFV